MSDNTARNMRRSDDINVEPQWPQRPERPQPQAAQQRLEPPAERTAGRPAPVQPGADNSRTTYRATTAPPPGPVAHPANGQGNTKETQTLPLVEPSRFDKGEATRIVSNGSSAAPQPQERPRQAPAPTPTPTPAQPQVR